MISNKAKLISEKLRVKLLKMISNIRDSSDRFKGQNNNALFTFMVHQDESYTAKKELSYKPLISVVIPVYNVSDDILTECIDSVLTQTYKKYELILVDDDSDMPSVRKTLHSYRRHSKINIIYRAENGGISKATNTGLFMNVFMP